MLKIEGLGDGDKPSDGTSDDVLGDIMSGEPNTEAENFVITKFSAGVRDSNRVNIFINHHFAFSLDMSQVVNLGVKVGQKLNAEQFKDLQKASEFGKLYQRALEWVLTRPHSLRETRDYLKRRQIKRNQTNRKRIGEELKPLPELQDEAIEMVIQRLLDKGYIDDHKFAEYFVENRFVKKGVSKKRLQLEMRKKGVDEEIINNVLRETPRDDREEIKKIIEKKRRKYNRQKMLQYLVGQGFNYQDALDAIEAADLE